MIKSYFPNLFFYWLKFIRDLYMLLGRHDIFFVQELGVYQQKMSQKPKTQKVLTFDRKDWSLIASSEIIQQTYNFGFSSSTFRYNIATKQMLLLPFGCVRREIIE